MKTIKSIDGKSLLIGGLLACTIFFATGAGAGGGAGFDPKTGIPAKGLPGMGVPGIPGGGLPGMGAPGIPGGGLPRMGVPGQAGKGQRIDPVTGLPVGGLPGMSVPGQAGKGQRIDPVTGLPVGGMGGPGGHWWDSLQQWQVISVENKPPFDASDPKNAKETANWIRKKTQRVRGMEPFAVTMDKSGKARVWYRKRDK